jgi:hypothetical protein
MFNTLYRCTRTIARHQNAPLAKSRRRYVEQLAAQGAAIHTIRATAGVAYRAPVLMKLDESSSVERKGVERAAKRWAHRGYRNASRRGPTKPTRSYDRQLVALRRSTTRIRPSAGSASAGDRCILSVHGCGEGTFAENFSPIIAIEENQPDGNSSLACRC